MAYAFGWMPGMPDAECSDRVRDHGTPSYEDFDLEIFDAEGAVEEADILNACEIALVGLRTRNKKEA